MVSGLTPGDILILNTPNGYSIPVCGLAPGEILILDTQYYYRRYSWTDTGY
jgi:hypothetical protein